MMRIDFWKSLPAGEQRTPLQALFLFMLLIGLARASTQMRADLLSPVSGDSIPSDVTFSWTSVEGASAYYLYVGTSEGAQDLVSTGEVQVTDCVVTGLPGGSDVYARLWTKVDGIWRYNDYRFRVADRAILISPEVGTALPIDLRFEWTSVGGASEYYLYIGTSQGARDVRESSAINATSYHVAGLPEGESIHVRLWTNLNGQWRYVDYVFNVLALRARLQTPVPSSSDVDPRATFSWTSVPGAEGYYLYVGTAPGLKDVVSSGTLTGTSFVAPPLDGNTTFYVRLWTINDGLWLYKDYEFKTLPIARLVKPFDGATGILVDQPIEWTSVAGAEAYYLYVGSEPGLKDYVDSGSKPATSFSPAALPGGRTMYVRLWVLHEGRWRYVDETFETAPEARFTYPKSGSIGIPESTTIRWSGVSNAQAYRLELGTAPNGTDLLVTDELQATEYGPVVLPAWSTVYGRIWVKHGGQWRQGAAVFSTRAWEEPSVLTWPAENGLYEGSLPFEWNAQPLAASYRLTIGTEPEGADIHDSGRIRSTRRFVGDLNEGSTYHATLFTHYLNGYVHVKKRTFIAQGGEAGFESLFQAAKSAASDVRAMAIDNIPAPASPLELRVRSLARWAADCNDYSTALLELIGDMAPQAQARKLFISLSPSVPVYDSHTLVEVFDPESSRWLPIDPTFALFPVRAADSIPATAAEVSAAVRARDWGAIDYQFFSPAGPAVAAGYYLDYPLLFTNVHDAGTLMPVDPVPSVIDFFQSLGSVVGGPPGPVAVRCLGESDIASVVIDGTEREYACTGPDRKTHVFLAGTAAPAEDGDQQIDFIRPLRFVFAAP